MRDIRVGDLISYLENDSYRRYCIVQELREEQFYGNWCETKENALKYSTGKREWGCLGKQQIKELDIRIEKPARSLRL